MATTVATNFFMNLTPDQVFNDNYDREFAFKRAMKVFLISYSHYKTLCPQLYQQKFDEYLQTMKDLFDFNPQNMDFIQQLETEVMNHSMALIIAVIKFKGRNRMVKPKVSLIPITGNKSVVELDCNSEEQLNVIHRKIFNFNQFQQLFSDDQTLVPSVVVRLEAETWVQSEERLNTFVMPYKAIHCEGFEDWFDFGRGVQLLIKIEFKTNTEPNITSQQLSEHYLHTSYYMIAKRLVQFRSGRQLTTGHRKNVHKVKVSYIRPGIDPNSEQAFWTTATTSNILQGIRQSVIHSKERFKKSLQTFKTIKFNDLQIGYQFTDEFEDSVCLCSEWCNWNAFFHYNPIYRFLMVRNNQLFLRNRTNVPDLYLFSTIYHSYMCGLGLQPNNPYPPTPVLQLMDSANDYRLRYHLNYFLKNKSFESEYKISHPSYAILNGLSYNILRDEVDIEALCQQLDANPFADNCLENLINYNKVLYDLHVLMSTITPFVPGVQKKRWFTEYNKLSRKQFCRYLKLSYDNRIDFYGVVFEYMFSEDYQYSSRLAKTDSEVMIRRMRQNVTNFKEPMNPFNIRIITNEFLNTYISVYKYIKRVDPMLPRTATSKAAANDVLKCCVTFDKDFIAFATSGKVFNFWEFEDELRIRQLDGMDREFIVFFTLKLYYIAYDIQSYCIKAILLHQKQNVYNKLHVSTQFEFIFNNSLIEERYQNVYPGEYLFQHNTDFTNNFNAFYDTFWGKALHETQRFTTIRDYANSGRAEYERLHFWWRHDGNNRLKFAAIFLNLNIAFNDTIDSSENIFNDCLIPSMEVLSQRYEHYLEVFDYLVYYLVKGNCFMIFSTIVFLLKEMHKLQNQVLCDANVGYYLSKPGWVQLFRTMSTVWKCLDELKALYIVFDDELERISETLNETKGLVKKVYKHFYTKLLSEWMDELSVVYSDNQNFPEYLSLVVMHTSVGLSFLATFIDTFRKDSNYMRKQLCYQISDTPDPKIRHQVLVHTFQPIVNAYLADKRAIIEATPLVRGIWPQMFAQVFNRLNRYTEQDVNIDLNESDVY